MSNPTLYRASYEMQPPDGRTLIGLAAPWNTPALVRDIIGGRPGPQYREAFDPRSADVSIAQRTSPFPVFVRHDYASDPVGIVHYTRSADGLMFEAPLSKTARADEILELVTDGAMRSVSIGFRPVKEVRSRDADGALLLRTEIMLRELSLAPTGYGAYPEAAILALRTEGDDDPLAQIAALDAVIDAALKCLDPTDDDFNPAQAHDLLVGAETTVDALLDALGIDDPDDLADDAPEPVQALMPMRMKIDAARHVGDLHRRTAREIASRPVPFIG